jgi:hypothetical protein
MDNPGPFPFTYNGGGAFPLGTAGTYQGDWIENFAGIDALSLEALFTTGAGGTSVTVYFQTSIDQGQTPIDIAAVQFTTSNGISIANVSALDKTNPFTPAQQSLTPGTVQDGVLGDRFRAVVVVVGAYATPAALALFGCAR